MGVARATYYRWKENANAGKCPKQHGNLGTKKPRTHTLQATATLRLMLERSADQMPHKSRTMEKGEKVVSKVLPSAWKWKDLLPELNDVNDTLGLRSVSATGLSRIRSKSFPEYNTKKRGDNFARCGQCDKLKKLRSACTQESCAEELWSKKFKAHLDA